MVRDPGSCPLWIPGPVEPNLLHVAREVCSARLPEPLGRKGPEHAAPTRPAPRGPRGRPPPGCCRGTRVSPSRRLQASQSLGPLSPSLLPFPSVCLSIGPGSPRAPRVSAGGTRARGGHRVPLPSFSCHLPPWREQDFRDRGGGSSALRKGMGTGKGRRRAAARAGIGAGLHPGARVELTRAPPSPVPPLPRPFRGRGAAESQEVTCAEAWSPGVTFGKCHRVLPFSQSAVPGRSPASPGPSDCGWQKPRVGLASCRSRRKVGDPAPGPLACGTGCPSLGPSSLRVRLH